MRNSKRINSQRIRPKKATKNSCTCYAVSLGIIFSLFFITNVIASFAEEKITIYIEDKDNCQNESCLSDEGIVIKQGDTVTWKNNDNTFHTILSGIQDYGRDGKFQSDMIIPGNEFTVTFDKEGYYYYYCDTHPWMKGVILVA